MKKIFITLALLLCVSMYANAQVSFVVKAGLNFSKMSDIKLGNLEQSWNAQTGFHAGIGAQYKIPKIGISFQPEVLYSRMRTNFHRPVTDHAYNFRIDYINVPLNLQWGIDLKAIRPYVFVAPYISYAIAKGELLENIEWDNLNRFDYGVGLGLGIELWKLQISGKYSWGFGKPFDKNGIDIDSEDWQLDDSHLKGFELSVAFLF